MFNNPFQNKKKEDDVEHSAEQQAEQAPQTEPCNAAEGAVADVPTEEEEEEVTAEQLLAEVNQLEAALADREREVADLKGRLVRLSADFDGFRNRTADSATESEAKGVTKAAEALMPVFDDVSRALQFGSEDPAKLIPGMEAVQGKILTIFANLGLEATGHAGEKFDPKLHEAIQVMPGEEGVILQCYELGFRMGDRSIRPARVAVGQP